MVIAYRTLIYAISRLQFAHLKMRSGLRYFTSNISAMKKISLLLPLAFALLLSSCSMLDNFGIEKRRYNKGFYVHKSENRNTGPATQPAATVTAPEQAVYTAPAPQTKEPANTTTATAAHSAPAVQQAAQPQDNNGRPDAPVDKTPDETAYAPAENVAQPEVNSPAPAAGDTELIILVILAILLSPLAVWLKEGASTRFWIDLICWILGGGLFFSPFFYGGLLLLFAIVFAVLIVLDVI